MIAEVQLGPLRGADGSAVFSSNGLSVLASVNGPIEVQRRDEIADEAAVEVSIRPAAGVGGVRERHFELVTQKVLRRIIRVSTYPRSLIQITLQITAIPDEDASAGRPSQAASMLYLLSPLLNAAMLALLSTSIPLFTTMSSTFVVVQADGSLVTNLSLQNLEKVSSVHALAYSSNGTLLLAESEGSFDIDTWTAVVEAAKEICCERASKQDKEDVEMLMSDNTSVGALFRNTVQERILASEKWRQAIK